MSCEQWRDLLAVESVDDLALARREDFLLHLRSCASCRRAAAEADPTVIFSLLPDESVEDGEIEEIRRSVQTMRRVRALEDSWSRRARRGLTVGGAFAAMMLAAVLLLPERPEVAPQENVPFAGAVGVGSGLVSVPKGRSDATSFEFEVELARSARMIDLSSFPNLRTVSHLAVTANVGEWVEGDLGNGYRIRFRVPPEVPIEGPILKGFQLVRKGQPGEALLFNADLDPLPSSPLILGITTTEDDEEQLWLRLTYSAEAAAVR